MSGKLTRNSAICHSCGDEIESTHRHDFVTCTCNALSVDGGLAYLRRSHAPGAPVTDTSTWTDDE